MGFGPAQISAKIKQSRSSPLISTNVFFKKSTNDISNPKMAIPALSSNLSQLAPIPFSLPQPQLSPTTQHVSFEQSKKPIESTVAWTSSISRYCRNGQLAQAATEFKRMRLAGATPNHVTIITLLSGCADFPAESGSFGPLIHAYAHKLGIDRDNVMVGTAIVDMYAKCGRVEPARMVFDKMSFRNLVTWNTMIDGLVRNGRTDAAVGLFDQMPERNVVSWTALIGGFIKSDHYEEALEWFREMLMSKVEPDYVSIIAVLAACANLGTLSLGLWLHRYVLKQDFRENVRISNSLIDMYSRCGCIEFALQVFQKMTKRTLVSWNSIIVGFATNGQAEKALEYFDLMQKEGLKPDGVTFTGVLAACSHAGLVDKGLQYFDMMRRVYRISPRIEHYGCIVDLHSRAGSLEDAFSVIEAMPMKPNEVVMGSLLAACSNCRNIGLAERLTKYLVELDPAIDSNYVLLSNTYAAVGRWDKASEVRRKMKALAIQKQLGLSSIEVGYNIHEFISGDKSHIETENIYATLELLSFDLKLCGYTPDTVVKDTYEV